MLSLFSICGHRRVHHSLPAPHQSVYKISRTNKFFGHFDRPICLDTSPKIRHAQVCAHTYANMDMYICITCHYIRHMSMHTFAHIQTQTRNAKFTSVYAYVCVIVSLYVEIGVQFYSHMHECTDVHLSQHHRSTIPKKVYKCAHTCMHVPMWIHMYVWI